MMRPTGKRNMTRTFSTQQIKINNDNTFLINKNLLKHLRNLQTRLVPEGSDGDGDLIITEENQGQAWRILINHMLADSRQIFLSGFSDGFSGLDLNGDQASCGFTTTLHGFMQDFTYQERQVRQTVTEQRRV